MEVFEALISLLVIVLAAYSSYKKKKAKEMAKGKGWDRLSVPSDPENALPHKMPLPDVQEKAAIAFPPSPVQQDFKSGFVSRPETSIVPEGVDPCHDDLYTDEHASQTVVYDKGAEQLADSSELVRAVVMAEILGTPRGRKQVFNRYRKER